MQMPYKILEVKKGSRLQPLGQIQTGTRVRGYFNLAGEKVLRSKASDSFPLLYSNIPILKNVKTILTEILTMQINFKKAAVVNRFEFYS